MTTKKLNEREKIIHEVDLRHTNNALWSRRCKSLKKIKKWIQKQKKDRKERNKSVNEKAADVREKVNLIRSQLPEVSRINMLGIQQNQRLIDLMHKRMEQRKKEQEMLALLTNRCLFHTSLDERLNIVNSTYLLALDKINILQ